MQCPGCNALLEEDTVFCGNCGRQVAPLQAKGATVAAPSEKLQAFDSISTPAGNDRAAQRAVLQTPSLRRPPSAPTTDIPVQSGTPGGQAQGPHSPIIPPFVPTPPPTRTRLSRSRRMTLIAALLLIIVAGGTVGILATLKYTNTGSNPGANAIGQVAFVDSQNGIAGRTDALKINISGLEAAPSGFEYDAWLINEQSEQVLALGTLTANGQAFSLNYAGNGGNGKAGTNLLGAGNKLEITLEQGAVTTPAGSVILSGTFPPLAFIHIKHLLFSFPTTPGKIGLLVGLQEQAQLLNAQALILQSVAASHNSFAIQCAAQSLIDIIEGTNGQHYQALPDSCISQHITETGDGLGILGSSGYVALAAAHAHLAATQPDATDNIKLHAGHVGIAMNNIEGWVTTVEQDALTLRTTPGNTAKVQEIVTLSDHAFHGIDINGDESIDPVPGEAGAITAYIHGQLMAALQLTPGV